MGKGYNERGMIGGVHPSPERKELTGEGQVNRCLGNSVAITSSTQGIKGITTIVSNTVVTSIFGVRFRANWG